MNVGRHFVKQLTVVGLVIVATAVVAGTAGAQGSATGPGNPTILDAVRQLSATLTAIQNDVNSIQTQLDTRGNLGARGSPSFRSGARAPTPRDRRARLRDATRRARLELGR